MLPEGTLISALIGGAISKVINDGVDYTKPKIKKLIKDNHDQNISTKIFRVIERALNIVTGNKYKDSDDLYNAIEKIFIEFKNHGDTLKSVKCGLNVLGVDTSEQRCDNFLENFYDGICKDNDLYKRISLFLQKQDIVLNQEEFQELNKKIENNHTELSKKVDSMSESLNGSNINNEKTSNTNDKDNKLQNNMKQYYIKNWNSRLFLHLDDDEKQLTLADAFIMPDYEIHQYSQKINFSDKDTLAFIMSDYRMHQYSQKINFSDKDTLEDMIEKFVNYDKTSTMLITGVPGMGKTTIVSWIAHKYETNDNLIILRFRDWESEDLDSGLLKAICNILECRRKDLNGKLLVLDGFDEMKSLDRREHILNEFLNGIKDLEKSKIIITSRPTYIITTYFHNRVKLLPFSVKKVQMFYQKITGIEINENEVDKGNLDVIGIPVILYMAIMSSIDITKRSTKPELYNRIFAEEGGIFDRFCEYDSGSQIIRNPDNIKKYLKFLKDVAFIMFEKDKLSLLKKECEVPELEFEGKNVSVLEFPIKHLFENTEANIEFIHKSVYEYFVSEYICWSINEIIKKDNFKIEELAGVMGKLFKYGELSPEIIEFLKDKVRNDKNFNDKFDIVNDTFNSMLKDGMTYYTGECYRNVIECELSVFANMLEIMRLWEDSVLKFDLLFIQYIKCNRINKLNLVELDLRGVNLSGVTLRKADLRKADLRKVNLIGADLGEADLREANLREADLIGAYLIGAYFDEEQIAYLKRHYKLQGTKVYIDKTGKFISYEEYCIGKC